MAEEQICISDVKTLHLKEHNMNHLSALSIFIYIVAVEQDDERYNSL